MLRVIALPEITQRGLSAVHSGLETKTVRTEAPPATAYPAYNDFIEGKDREIILWALEETHYNTSSAAKLLKIPRSTLRSKMEKYGIKQRDAGLEQGADAI